MLRVDTLLRPLAPHYCLGCGVIGGILCDNCGEMIQTLPPRCYRCLKSDKTGMWRTCRSCRSSSRLRRVYAWGDYSDVLKELVRSLKYNRNLSAAQAAAHLLPLPHEFFAALVPFVPVPTTPGRVRQRGYDQAQLLAQALSRRYTVPTTLLLRRIGEQHQVGSSASTRHRQLQGAFALTNAKESLPRRVVLVDDVLTTGATLEAAAKMLHAAGVKQIDAVVIAQAS